MTQRDKLFKKAEDNPKGLRYTEFETILEQSGWVKDHQTGSHRIWRSPAGLRLSTQPMKDGNAKSYQVKQFLKAYYDEQK